MTKPNITEEQLKDLIREVVREELLRLNGETTSQNLSTGSVSDIDTLADQIFEKYDDVFQKLA